MKILIVVTHGNIGGTANFVFLLAKGIKNKNVEIKVAFGNGDYLKEKLEKENISYLNFKWLRRTHNPFSNLLFIFEIKKLLDKEKFDIIHLNSTNALFGAIGAKLSKNKPKIIFNFHGLSVLDNNYKKFFLLKPIYHLTFKLLSYFIDLPIFTSYQNLRFIQKNKLIKNKGVVIYNGIPKPKFLLKENARFFLKKELKINLENKFIIGSIGRLDYAKNYEFLIKIFPEILKINQNAICIIIGNGNEIKNLKNLIKKYNLKEKIFLTGEIKNANKYLKAFDVFILPSKYEGLSISLIEALFAQIPILASEVGGNSEIINKKFIYKLNNQKDFLEKFNQINKNKEYFNKKYITLKKLNVKTMVNSYFKLYKKILSNF